MREHVQRLNVQGLRAVVIQKKSKGAVLLSQGYGFLEFSDTRCAEDALNKLNGSVLDDHALEVKPSDKKISIPSSATSRNLKGSGSRSTKLIVRNIAFQATKSEIRALFATFGSVRTVRIPKQVGGKHRGFAFVDFATEQEATNAASALKNAHLYGRHLVIEWAKDEDENNIPEEILAKTIGQSSVEISSSTRDASQSRKRALLDSAALSIKLKQKRKSNSAQQSIDAHDEQLSDVM